MNYETEDTDVTTRYLDDGVANPAPEMPDALYQDFCEVYDRTSPSYTYGDMYGPRDSLGSEDGGYESNKEATFAAQDSNTFLKF